MVVSYRTSVQSTKYPLQHPSQQTPKTKTLIPVVSVISLFISLQKNDFHLLKQSRYNRSCCKRRASSVVMVTCSVIYLLTHLDLSVFELLAFYFCLLLTWTGLGFSVKCYSQAWRDTHWSARNRRFLSREQTRRCRRGWCMSTHEYSRVTELTGIMKDLVVSPFPLRDPLYYHHHHHLPWPGVALPFKRWHPSYIFLERRTWAACLAWERKC